jgi:hypothetical protein
VNYEGNHFSSIDTVLSTVMQKEYINESDCLGAENIVY